MMWRNRIFPALALLAAAAPAACGGADEADEAPEAVVVEQPAGAMQGMEGMHDMAGMHPSGAMMEQMQVHLQQMEGVDGEGYRAMLPQHRQMVANMIAQMNREMREMNMAGDEEWSSTVEALREDLKRLPEMSPPELEAAMPEHRRRVAHLMEMHREMVAGMGM